MRKIFLSDFFTEQENFEAVVFLISYVSWSPCHSFSHLANSDCVFVVLVSVCGGVAGVWLLLLGEKCHPVSLVLLFPCLLRPGMVLCGCLSSCLSFLLEFLLLGEGDGDLDGEGSLVLLLGRLLSSSLV